MPIQKIAIEEFLKLAKQYRVLDVRSPGEFAHAHIPTANSLPLFTDEERKQVGTAYKQQSREVAIKIGLDHFGLKMRKMVEEVESLTGQASMANTVLVHCWRGGMRSAAVAWLLDIYGFKVYVLTGGYKAYRKWVLAQFEKNYPFHIIGGYTGSGKTRLLHQLQIQYKTIIDLEELAVHKGSAFGSVTGEPQPRQEMFENKLARELHQISTAATVYIEDESQRIGNVLIPNQLWHTMRRSPLFFMDISFEARLDYIVQEYGEQDKEILKAGIWRIQKRLGGLEAGNAARFLDEGNVEASFRILLNYYDKWYSKALHKRENVSSMLNKIPCTGVDSEINAQKLLSCSIVNQ